MQRLFAFAERLPYQFWFQNYTFAILYLFMTDFTFFTFLIFPPAVLLLDFINSYYLRKRQIRPYIGFLFMKSGLINLLLTLAINYAVYRFAWPLLIFGLIFVYLKEERILP